MRLLIAPRDVRMLCNLVRKWETRPACHSAVYRWIASSAAFLTDKNYFDVLGFPASYDIADDQLVASYRRLLKESHPDRFQHKSGQEKERSEEQSRLITEAYRTLRNPHTRGLHLLEVQRVALPPEEQLEPASARLLAVYETNEELQQTQDPDRLQAIKRANDATLRTLIEQVSAAFDNRQLEQAQRLLSQMKYYATIEEKIRLVELELGVVR